MKNKKFKFSILLLGIGITIQAQQSTIASGGNSSGNGGTVSYSIGQLVYTTLAGSTGSVAQGVQQPFEISVVLGLEEHQISLNMQAYPNPTTDYLKLMIANFELSTLNFELYDINGKLMESKKISGAIETIRMDYLPRAIYFLKVTSNDKELKTFKIIKN